MCDSEKPIVALVKKNIKDLIAKLSVDDYVVQPEIIDSIIALANNYLNKPSNNYASQAIKHSDFEAAYVRPLQLYCLALHLSLHCSEVNGSVTQANQKIAELIKQYVSDQFKKDIELTFTELQELRARLKGIQDAQPRTPQIITKALKELFITLIEKAFSLSCYIKNEQLVKYAFIGLGSLSRSEMTPYSDLEFGLLITNQKQAATFEKIVRLLHLLVISLGQTPVDDKLFTSEMEIKLKPYFKNKLFMPRGFSFDSACRTPLGNQPFNYETAKFKLLGTVDELLSFVVDDEWFANDFRFFSQLSQADFITGNKEVYDDYQSGLRQYLSEKNDSKNKKILKTYQYNLTALAPHLKTVGDYEATLKNYNITMQKALPEDLSFSLKHEFYRFVERTIDALHLYYYSELAIRDRNAELTTQLKIDDLCQAGQLNLTLASKLKQLLNLIFKYRCIVYQYYQGQIENIHLKHEPLKKFLPEQHSTGQPLYTVIGQELIQHYGFICDFYDRAKQFIGFCKQRSGVSPWLSEPYELRYSNLREIAENAYTEKDDEKAKCLYQDLIKIPNQENKHHDHQRLGKIYLRLFEFEQAVVQFEEAYKYLESNQYSKLNKPEKLRLLVKYKLLAGIAQYKQAMASDEGVENSYKTAIGYYKQSFQVSEKLLRKLKNLNANFQEKKSTDISYFYCESKEGAVQLAALGYHLSQCHLGLADYYFIQNKLKISDYEIAKEYFKLYKSEFSKLKPEQLKKLQVYLDIANSNPKENYLKNLAERTHTDSFKRVLNKRINHYKFNMSQLTNESKFASIRLKLQEQLLECRAMLTSKEPAADGKITRPYSPQFFTSSSQQIPLLNPDKILEYKHIFSEFIEEKKQAAKVYKPAYPSQRTIDRIIRELGALQKKINALTNDSTPRILKDNIDLIDNLLGSASGEPPFNDLVDKLRNQHLTFWKGVVIEQYMAKLQIKKIPCDQHNLSPILTRIKTNMREEQRYTESPSAYCYYHYLLEQSRAELNLKDDIALIFTHLAEAGIYLNRDDNDRQELVDSIKPLMLGQAADNCILLFLTPALHLLQIEQTYECDKPYTIDYLITKSKYENLPLYLLKICWLGADFSNDTKLRLFQFKNKVYKNSLCELIENIFLQVYPQQELEQGINEILSTLRNIAFSSADNTPSKFSNRS